MRAPRLAVALLFALVAAVAALLLLGTPRADAAAAAMTIHSGSRDFPRIALTFDDNLAPKCAVPALRVLREKEVPATVFVTGWYVMSYSDINAELVGGKFEIGDHTMSHPDLSKLGWDALLHEIGGGTSTFFSRFNMRTVPYFRPPGGISNPLVTQAAAAKGFTHLVLWDIDTGDWKGLSPQQITDTALKNAHNGAIILMHLGAANTCKALPGIIDGLRARGYELVTVSGLLKGNRRFVDVGPGTPSGGAVERMVAEGYMSGYDANWFGPADPLSRAQFAKVAVLVTGLHTDGIEVATPTFADVPLLADAAGQPLEYPFDFVEEATAAGIIQGMNRADGQRIFNPNAQLSRVQLARIVARMARLFKGYPVEVPGATAFRFRDVPPDAIADVRLVAQLGLMGGYTDGTFHPEAKAQRAHAAAVMSRYLDLQPY